MKRRITLLLLASASLPLFLEVILYASPYFSHFAFLGIDRVDGHKSYDLNFFFHYLTDCVPGQITTCSAGVFNYPIFSLHFMSFLRGVIPVPTLTAPILNNVLFLASTILLSTLVVLRGRGLSRLLFSALFLFSYLGSFPVRLILERSNLDLLIFSVTSFSCLFLTYIISSYILIESSQGFAPFLRILSIIALLAFGSFSTLLKIYPISALIASLVIVAPFYLRLERCRSLRIFMAFSSVLSLSLVLEYILRQLRGGLLSRVPSDLFGGDLFYGFAADTRSNFADSSLEVFLYKISVILLGLFIFAPRANLLFQCRPRLALAPKACRSHIFCLVSTIVFGSISLFAYSAGLSIVYRLIFLFPPLFCAFFADSLKSELFSPALSLRRCQLGLVGMLSGFTFYYSYLPYVPELKFVSKFFVYIFCHTMLFSFILCAVLASASALLGLLKGADLPTASNALRI